MTAYEVHISDWSSDVCSSDLLRLCAIVYRSEFNAFNQDVRFDYDGGPFKAILGAFYGSDQVIADNGPDFFNFLSYVPAALGLPGTSFNPCGAFNGAGLSAGSSDERHVGMECVITFSSWSSPFILK